MEYRGVRYAIRIGIARGQWQVAVYLPDKELPKETTVLGTLQNAEIAASSIIDAWLKKRSGTRCSVALPELAAPETGPLSFVGS
jgi:hypothetical protein